MFNKSSIQFLKKDFQDSFLYLFSNIFKEFDQTNHPNKLKEEEKKAILTIPQESTFGE